MKPLLLTIALLNGADIATTNAEMRWTNAQGRMARETNPLLPDSPWKNATLQTAFDAAAIPAIWKLHKNHPKLAWALALADVANACVGLKQNYSTWKYYGGGRR